MALGMVLAGGIALAAVMAGLDSRPADAVQATPGPWAAAAPQGDAGRPAGSGGAPGGWSAPVAAQAPAATVQAQPAPAADPTAALAQAVPQPIPLARAQRDASAGARLDAAAAAPPPARSTLQVQASPANGQVDALDTAGRPVRAELAQASIDETALGLRYLPGSQAVSGSGRRVPDGAGGEAVSVQLMGSGTLETATQFYQAQLASPGVSPASVQVQQPAPGQVLLHARDPRSGVERTVWIVRNGDQLGIVLARARQGQTQTP